ncbi:MAG TPA: hypothetical protein VFZ97_12595 [Acidimicrobiales bacterium]
MGIDLNEVRRGIRRRQAVRYLLTGVLVVLFLPAAAAQGVENASYAPVNRPGPALSVPAENLAQSMRCTSDLVESGRDPILFVAPTLVNPDEAYFGYERAFDALAIPYCTLTIPFFTTEDIQVSAEYVVYAIRTIHAHAGRRITLLGWSQGGGPEPRWALRFWPDIRPMTAKLVDLEAPNHGTVVVHDLCPGGICANPLCYGSCPPAIWQQADNSHFTAALNSGQETFPGISYTNIFSHTSQFVQPNLNGNGSTSLHFGGGAIANIATQDICPLNVADHLAYYYDPVAYALVVDALTHNGPAQPTRIDRSVCSRLAMPYIDPTDIPTYTAHLYNAIFVDRFHNVPQTTAEPPLKCYVTASCQGMSPKSPR